MLLPSAGLLRAGTYQLNYLRTHRSRSCRPTTQARGSGSCDQTRGPERGLEQWIARCDTDSQESLGLANPIVEVGAARMRPFDSTGWSPFTIECRWIGAPGPGTGVICAPGRNRQRPIINRILVGHSDG